MLAMRVPPLSSGLYTDFYELTMAQGYYVLGMQDTPAVFDLYFRTCPFNGAYAVAAGIAEAVEAVLQLCFSDDECSYLSDLGFRPDFLSYLKNFKFTGDLDGCREGEIVFPGTCLLRVSAPLIQAQLLESMLLNIVNFQTLIATKALRTVYAAQGKPVVDFGLRRAQGQASLAATRAAFIGGVIGTSNTYAARYYGIPAVGTHAHSWVQSFDTEYEALSAYARLYPDAPTLLIDTYDTLRSGLPAALRVAQELQSSGKMLRAVRIDSGDILNISKQVRSQLDAAGLFSVKIVASDQLDEYRIAHLLEHKAPIDLFGVGTKLICAYDQPALDGVYKLAECKGRPRLKCSDDPSKVNNPGRKKTARYYSAGGDCYCDVLMLDDEDPAQISCFHLVHHPESMITLQQPVKYDLLTIPLVRGGKQVFTFPTLKEMQEYARERFSHLPAPHKCLIDPIPYPIGLSERLYHVKQSLIQQVNCNA